MKIVDTREPDTIRLKLLETGWEQKQLYSGDFSFPTHDNARVVITRKAVPDLLASIGERLSNQLEEILECSEIHILLLEGSWQTINPNQHLVTGRGISYTTWSMIWNYLRRWQDKGFTLELTINEGHTIQRLNELYALYQKPYSLSANTRSFTDDRVLAFPSGCRGKTAMDCLTFWGSLEAVALASVEELDEVNGIGLKRANLIYEHFHRRTISEQKLGVGTSQTQQE